jgi:hypothetical protein
MAAAKKAAKRASRPANPDRQTPDIDTPPADETMRADQLAKADDAGDDDEGPKNAREYFARVNKPMTAHATIEDLCSVLEAFGYSDVPEGYATPHALR